MIILTDAERTRFITYLLQEAESDGAMANQLEKLGPFHAVGVNMCRINAAAAERMAKKLQSTVDV